MTPSKTLAFAAAAALACAAMPTLAQHADHDKPPVAMMAPQPPARLVVDEPIASLLANGVVILPYHAENLHFLPVFGAAGLSVWPRVGHVHVTVDDGPWHWVDASGEPLVIQGLPAGPHKVLVELADAAHHVLDSKTVSLVIPPRTAAR